MGRRGGIGLSLGWLSSRGKIWDKVASGGSADVLLASGDRKGKDAPKEGWDNGSLRRPGRWLYATGRATQEAGGCSWGA